MTAPRLGPDILPFVRPANFAPSDPAEFVHDPIAFLRATYRAHGATVTPLPGRDDCVIALGPEANRQILTQPEIFHATGFLLPGPRGSAQRRHASGLFGMNGPTHRRRRRQMLPAFHRDAIAAYHNAIVAIIDDHLSQWRPGERRDLAHEMIELVVAISSKTLFGADDLATAQEVHRLADHWGTSCASLMLRRSLGLPTSSAEYQEVLAVGDRLEQHIRAIVERKRTDGRLGTDFLSFLLRAQAATDESLSDGELIGQITHFFNAANHTTQSALTWTLFLLAQHPAVMARLLRDCDRTLGGPAPTSDQLDRLPYLDWVLKESMRLLPPVAYYSRITAAPVELGPLQLRKGTTVLFSHYITHHMPGIYPEPERFLPERWQTANPGPYAYLPFGAGPRMCLGAAFAMMTLKIALATIVQRYRLTVVNGARIDRRVTTTLFPAAGMPMTIHPQDGRFLNSWVVGNIHEMVDLPGTASLRQAA